MPHNELANAVVVITGASSGIGRATALAFARQGASVVLAARREATLLDVARACEAFGGAAIAVPTDVSVENEVQSLVQTALDRFGRVDVWVNNASVTAIATFEDTPPDVFRQVIETNLFGYVYGARAVLPVFRRQARGVLVNVESMAARAPHPYASAYVAAKSAVHAFSKTLRMELRLGGAHDIHVCSVLPGVMDTPLFQHAANFTGRAVRAVRPVYAPEEVAQAIVELARAPKREVIVGVHAKTMIAHHTTMPRLYERLAPPYVEHELFTGRAAPPSTGNVFQPTGPDTIRGGWHGKTSGSALRKAAAVGIVAAGLVLLARQQRT